MIDILREFEEEGYRVTEYTKNGKTVSHTVKTPIQTKPTEPQPSINEQILFETKFQTMLLEMGGVV